MTVTIEAPMNYPAETELAWLTEDPLVISHFKLYRADRSDAAAGSFTLVATIPNVPDAGRRGSFTGANAPRGGARRSKVHYSVSKTQDLTYHYKVQRILRNGTPHADDVDLDDIPVRSVPSFEEISHYGNYAATGNRPLIKGRTVVTVPTGTTFADPIIFDFIRRHGRPGAFLKLVPEASGITIRLSNLNNDDIVLPTVADPAIPFVLSEDAVEAAVSRVFFANSTGGDIDVEMFYSYLTP